MSLRRSAWWFVAILIGAALTGCPQSSGQPRVVLYCAQDQEFAEKLLDEFKDKNGIKVAETQGFTQPGLHKLNWLLNVKGTKAGDYDPVPAGTYTVTLQVGQKKLSKTVEVEVEE